MAEHGERPPAVEKEKVKKPWYKSKWVWAVAIIIVIIAVIPTEEETDKEAIATTEEVEAPPDEPEEPAVPFAEMMARVDSLEADSSYAAAKGRLREIVMDYPDSLSKHDIAPRLASLDSLIEEKRARERAEGEARRLAAKWSYRTSTDEMTSRTTRLATIQSENTINLDFPYEGEQHGTLVIRNHPSYGRDVIFRIREGQLQCPSYSGCTVRVRFDEHSPRSWSAGGPSDNDTTVLFIRNYSGFLSQLRRSEIVRIQPEIYQAGAPVFEFHVGGFNYDRYRGRE